MEALKAKLAGVLAEYSSSSAKMKQRISKLESSNSAFEADRGKMMMMGCYGAEGEKGEEEEKGEGEEEKGEEEDDDDRA